MQIRVQKIVSGGQTGVDRAALDAAATLGLQRGGWCPRGRRAEDGVIPRHYPLQETDSPRYDVRTRRNVRDSDATLILHRGTLRGGTRFTAEYCRQRRKPCLLVDLSQTRAPSTRFTSGWPNTGSWSSTWPVRANPASQESPSRHTIFCSASCVRPRIAARRRRWQFPLLPHRAAQGASGGNWSTNQRNASKYSGGNASLWSVPCNTTNRLSPPGAASNSFRPSAMGIVRSASPCVCNNGPC